MDFFILSIYSPDSLVITGDASISSHIPRLDFVIRLGSRGMWSECPYIKGLTVIEIYHLYNIWQLYVFFGWICRLCGSHLEGVVFKATLLLKYCDLLTKGCYEFVFCLDSVA